MAKKKTTATRKPTDATMRNVRAAKQREQKFAAVGKRLEKRVDHLDDVVTWLSVRVDALEVEAQE